MSSAHEACIDDEDLDPAALKKAFNFATWSSVVLVRPSFSFTVLVPKLTHSFNEAIDLDYNSTATTLFASTIYGTAGLTAWIVIGIIWTFFSAFAVVVYPLWESREALTMIFRGIIKVLNISNAVGS